MLLTYPSFRQMRRGFAGRAFLACAVAAGFTASAFCFEMRGGLRASLCGDADKPYFAPSSGPGGVVYRPARAWAMSPDAAFTMPKPAGTKRVFIIGGSNAGLLSRPCGEGSGDCFSSLSAALGHRTEVINCGLPASNSRGTYAVMKEIMNYSPDAVIVLVGHGERMELCPGPGERLRQRAYMAMNLLFWRLPLPDLTSKFALDGLRSALRKMSRLAEKRGVPLVFCTLPLNLADFPPMGALPLGERGFAGGWEAYGKGDYAAAARAFSEYSRERPGEAMGEYYAGLSLLRLGNGEAARGMLLKAAESDSHPSCASSCNNAIRESVRGSKTMLADIEGLFYRLAPEGVPGGGMFMDKIHWYGEYDRAVACEIMDKLSGPDGKFAPEKGAARRNSFCGGGTPSSAPPAVARAGILSRYLLFYMELLSGPGVSGGSIAEIPAAFIRRIYRLDREYLAEISRSPGSFAASAGRAREFYLVRTQPENLGRLWPYYLAHLVEALNREGAPELAAALFNRAVKAAPGDVKSCLLRAGKSLRSGDRKKAPAAILGCSGGDAGGAGNK